MNDKNQIEYDVTKSKHLIRTAIKSLFTIGEVKQMLFTLDVEYEVIDGINKKSVEIVSYFGNRRRLHEVWDYIASERSDSVYWKLSDGKSVEPPEIESVVVEERNPDDLDHLIGRMEIAMLEQQSILAVMKRIRLEQR